jgi:hypothetical protein
MSKDGSQFDPITCRRLRGYRVGTKKRSWNILDFSEAVAALKVMSEPRWWRPNQKGDWGLVTGVSWTAGI